MALDVKAGVAAAVTSCGVEIHLVDVDSGGLGRGAWQLRLRIFVCRRSWQRGYSHLTVGPAWSMGSRRVLGGAGEQDTGLVMGRISVSAAGAFDVFDASVRGLGTGIGDVVGDQHLDR